MRRVVALIVVGLLALSACSTGGGASSATRADAPLGSGTVVDDGPEARLCVRWAEFEALLESDAEPTDELIAQMLERQRGIDEVLPDELAPAWADITGWTAAFIEFFSAAGYQEVDEDAMATIFGGEQAAEDAVDALEVGFTAMREWSARNCAGGEGDARAFCSAWTDISAQLGRLDEEAPTKERIDELFAAYTEASPVVPREIRDDWDALLAFATPFRDVLVTVEYDIDRVSDELLAEAFGSLDAVETLELAAEQGREAIDTWSLDGCGGFCVRWGETREAVDHLRHDLGWVVDMGEEGPRQLRVMQARLELAAQQLPDRLGSEWGLMMVVLDDWYGHWESLGFDRSRAFESDEGRAAQAAIAREAEYLPELLMQMEGHANTDDAAADLRSRSDHELADTWMGAVDHVTWTTMERIDAWVDKNCDVAGGLPGRLRVTWPKLDGAAGSTIVVAVMPAGATVEDLGDLDVRAAGYCEQVHSDPWGFDVDPEGHTHRWESDWFRSETVEGDQESLCEFAWEEGPAVLEPGTSTLLAAMVPGGVRGRTLPAAPTACTAREFVVDGDTTARLPRLHACDAGLPELVVEAEPWQVRDPVDPATPGAGTLRVTVPSLTLPDGIEAEYGGELKIVVLPAGTTLNQVGREQIWPSGGYRGHLERVGENEHTRELARLGAVTVPIMAVPPTGVFGGFDPWWLVEATDDELPLVLLAPGEYDVHAEISGHSEGGEDRRCGRATVTVDGPTVIDMPELGGCP